MFLQAALRVVAETLFPARCIGCQRRGTPLCDTCRDELPYLPGGVCARCATLRSGAHACRGCRRLAPALSTVHAAFVYEGAARSAVLSLKSRSGRHLAPLMGELVRERLELRPLRADVVVPVPLAPRRLRERGFNQAALLAREIATAVDGQVADVLVRQERTAQKRLSAAERLTNLEGAFQCASPLEIVNRRVLLVDDVVTTGATASACAVTLADAGASRVSVLAFARGL